MPKDKIIDGYITVSLLGSGYAAVHRVLVKEMNPDGTWDEPYWDVEQTGIGRYSTRDEAVVEARDWAKSEEIKLQLD